MAIKMHSMPNLEVLHRLLMPLPAMLLMLVENTVKKLAPSTQVAALLLVRCKQWTLS